MAKKYCMYTFTASATKALKNAERLMCKVDADGAIYVFSGYFIYKMNSFEYEAIARPVTMCDPGEWTIERDGSRHDVCNLDAIKIFADAYDATGSGSTLERSPMAFGTPDKKGTMCGFYNREKDFSAFYNQVFVDSISPVSGVEFRSAKNLSPAVVYMGENPVALIMPVHAKPEYSRAVKAFFTDSAEHQADAPDAGKIEALNNELATCKDDLQRTQDELASCRIGLQHSQDELADKNSQLLQAQNEIAALREQLAQQAAQSAAAESKPEPKTAAEMIAARFADMAGVTATIKGANTAAPVVWLAGNTKRHAAEIEAAGAQWSTKKSAYYFRVA